jgi:small subunit ribosomal protein S1
LANKRLVEQNSVQSDVLEAEVTKILSEMEPTEIKKIYDESMKEFRVDTIVKGRVLRTVGDVVLVDIAYKSEGMVPKSDFAHPDQYKAGNEIEVYLESIEDETGFVALSKQKADRIRGWERIITSNREGDPLRGRVIRKVKGGLLVDVGVPVFLPASQVDIHKVEDIGEIIGKEIEVSIIKIDEKRMNVIVSRKKFLEGQRSELRKKLLSELKEGDMLKGVVKNLSDYGAFVDIGGCDALLYLSDISWARIQHPSEVLKAGQELTVKVLKIDTENERISVGLKQLQPNPWEKVIGKYPVGAKLKGKVVNVVPYGVFVELEPGIEGLVHISEMAWTKQPQHPGEMVKVGDEVGVAVISVNLDKQEIGLSMKQAVENPWEVAAARYDTGAKVTGKVKGFVNYGAFVEIENGIEGLVHVRDMSWTRRLGHPSEMLQKNQDLELMVLSISKEKKKLSLGLKQLQENPWETVIPEKYKEGTFVTGKVSKVVSFGVFVELEKDLEGLIHSSRMGKKDASLATGDVIEAKVEKLDLKEGKIGLALTNIIEKAKPEEGGVPAAPPPEEVPPPEPIRLKPSE